MSLIKHIHLIGIRSKVLAVCSLILSLVLLSNGVDGRQIHKAEEVDFNRTVNTIVLFTSADRAELRRFECSADNDCLLRDLESFNCPRSAPQADNVVLTGHSTPPLYLGLPAAAITRAISCFRPKVVVLDTCYGFSAPLLGSLASLKPSVIVVGATYAISPDEMVYGTPFFESRDPKERAKAVGNRWGRPLQVWRPDLKVLNASRREYDSWNVGDIQEMLRHSGYGLVEVPISGSFEGLTHIVVDDRFATWPIPSR